MFKKLLRNRQAWILLAGLLVVLLTPAVIVLHHSPASASGGGGGNPTANIYPSGGSPGTSINVSGYNYPPNVKITTFFQTPSNGEVSTYTDLGGFFSVQLNTPLQYVVGTRYYVHVNSGVYRAAFLFTFTKPTLSINNYYGGSIAFGAQAFLNGAGFATNETVDLTWDYGSLGKFKAGLVGTDSSGFFFNNLTMPSIPFGIQASLRAKGRISGLTASVLVNESPAAYAIPNFGVIGSQVNLSAGGFASNENVRVIFQGTTVAKGKADVKGAFNASFAVPANATIGYLYNGILVTGRTSGVGATADFSVEPNVAITPKTGTSGTPITIIGGHFTPSGYVIIFWNDQNGGGSGGQRYLASVQASAKGTFRIVVTAPHRLVKGETYYVLVIDEQTGGSNHAKFLAQ